MVQEFQIISVFLQ